MADTRCVAAVPLHLWPLAPAEAIALDFLREHLPTTPILALAPESLSLRGLDCEVLRFPDACFADRESYSKLLLSRPFYDRFEDWEWLLVVQPDALVLRSDLADWLTAGWDYIGAPWVSKRKDAPAHFSRVGNGGLSLRRVASFCSVLAGRLPPASWSSIFRGRCAPDLLELGLGKRLAKSLQIWKETRVGARGYTEAYSLNEDRFWSDRARIFATDFSIAPVEAGLRFAFEEEPRRAFETIGTLPFGAHAWQKHDLRFWLERLPPLRALPW